MALFSFLVPKGWHTSGTAEDKYDMGVFKAGGHNSKACGIIRSNKKNYFKDDYGLLMQSFSAAKYQGKRVRFSGFIKARNVEVWAGLFLRIDKEKGKEPLGFDNMNERPIKGSSDWNEYYIDMDVPGNAYKITFGALLHGQGMMYFDDLKFEVIGKAEDTTAAIPITDAELQKEGVNLDFEN